MPSLDMSGYLDDDTLTLENIPSPKHKNGRSYEVPSMSAADGLLLQQVLSVDEDDPESVKASNNALKKLLKGPGGTTLTLSEKVLGSALGEMIDDGLSQEAVRKIEQTVSLHYGFGAEAARSVIEKTREGEAEARAKRAETKPTRRSTAGSKSGRASTPARAPRTTRTGTRTTGASGTSATPRGAARKTA